MSSEVKPFQCPELGCRMSFTNEDHLNVHRKKHQMSLSLGAGGNKLTPFISFADQTPTPTKFLRNCEEIGLFHELNKNPFEEAFKKASDFTCPKSDGHHSTENESEGFSGLPGPSVETGTTLHTPSVPKPVVEAEAEEKEGEKDDDEEEGVEQVAETVEIVVEGPDDMEEAEEEEVVVDQSKPSPQPSPAPPPPPAELPAPPLPDHPVEPPAAAVITPPVIIPQPQPVPVSVQAQVVEVAPPVDRKAIATAVPPPVSVVTSPPPTVTVTPPQPSIHPTAAAPPVAPPALIKPPAPQMMMQVLLQLPNGQTIPVNVPAGLANPAVQIPPAVQQQVRSPPAAVVVPSTTVMAQATSTSSLAKQKLRESLTQGAAQQAAGGHGLDKVSPQRLATLPSLVSMSPTSPDLNRSLLADTTSASADSSTPAKRSRRSPDEADPDERRRKFLERNRAAAARCRMKRKSWIGSLEKKGEELQDVNVRLQQEVTLLRSEVAQLKTILLAHKDCPVTRQQRSQGQLSIQTVESPGNGVQEVYSIVLPSDKVTNAEAIATSALTNMAQGSGKLTSGQAVTLVASNSSSNEDASE